MSASPALGNEFSACLLVPGTAGHHARPCMGHREEQGRIADLGEGTRPRRTLLLQLPRGVSIGLGAQVLRKVPSEPEQPLLVASEVRVQQEL